MKRFHTHLAAFAAALFAGSALAPSTAEATLVLEPVFNRVSEGVADVALGIFSPGVLNFFPEAPGTVGQPFLTADEPGEVIRYAASSVPDPALVPGGVFVAIRNNTDFAITGWTLTIVGPAEVDRNDLNDDNPFNFNVTEGPVDAIWGDVDGGGITSGIFGIVTLSADLRTITFSDGLIPVGGLFTDFNLASLTNDLDPFTAAGIDAQFFGVRAVPEPPVLALLGIGLLALLVVRRGRGTPHGRGT